MITVDGSVKLEIHDAPRDAAERLLEKIIDGTFGTAKQIASAASDALGAEKVEEGSQ